MGFVFGGHMIELLGDTPTNEARTELQARLRLELSKLKTNRILGARLGEQLNRCFSSNSFKKWLPTEANSLAHFVDTYLEGIIKKTKERQGTDFLYEILLLNANNSAEDNYNGALWKSFSAVTPSKHILYKEEEGLILLDSVINYPENTHFISNVNHEEHGRIFLDFAERLESENRGISELTNIAKNYSGTSYNKLVYIIRKGGRNLLSEWGIFRLEKMLGIFRSRLEEIGVDNEKISRFVDILKKDQGTSRIQPSLLTVNDTAFSKIIDSNNIEIETYARRVLRNAIDHMNVDQLKRIQLPFDVVLTLLRNAKL